MSSIINTWFEYHSYNSVGQIRQSFKFGSTEMRRSIRCTKSFSQHIPYYRGCLNPAFSEGQSLVVKMEEGEGLVVDGLLAWLYTGTFEGVQERFVEKGYAIRLYRLVDKLLISDLKNQVVDEFRRQMRKHNVSPDVEDIVCVSELGLLNTWLGMFNLRYNIWSLHQNAARWVDTLYNEQVEESKTTALGPLFNDAHAIAGFIKLEILYLEGKWDNPLNADDCDFHDHGRYGERCVLAKTDDGGSSTKKRQIQSMS